MKKALKITVVVLVVLPLVTWAYLVYNADTNRAVPLESALTALQSDDQVLVENDKWVVMRPAAGTPNIGVILYPGAHCMVEGYSEIMKPVAAAGYLVVGVKMPFEFSIFAPNRADEVRDAFPEIEQWFISGHSMGGAMAGRYADLNQDSLAGLILLDAYPPAANSLADSSLPVLHVHRARPDGTAPQKFEEMREVFPPDSVWAPVPGGNHMNFGAFLGGAYVEEWEPEISREAQHEIIVDAILGWLPPTDASSP